MVESISMMGTVTPESAVRMLKGQTPTPAIIRSVENHDSESRDMLDRAVSRIESFISNLARDLEFEVDEISGRTIVTVREQSTGKIIRQIPPREILAVAAEIRSAIEDQNVSGILFRTNI